MPCYDITFLTKESVHLTYRLVRLTDIFCFNDMYQAHCLSSWSYNFRPAFLRIRRELNFLRPDSVLALTATASPPVQRDICTFLRMDSRTDVRAMSSRRENLCYRATEILHSEDRYEAILKLLRGDKGGIGGVLSTSNKEGDMRGHSSSFGLSKPRSVPKEASAKQSTIVYVWRRDEATSLADYLQGSGVSAGSYHAGMTRVS